MLIQLNAVTTSDLYDYKASELSHPFINGETANSFFDENRDMQQMMPEAYCCTHPCGMDQDSDKFQNDQPTQTVTEVSGASGYKHRTTATLLLDPSEYDTETVKSMTRVNFGCTVGPCSDTMIQTPSGQYGGAMGWHGGHHHMPSDIAFNHFASAVVGAPGSAYSVMFESVHTMVRAWRRGRYPPWLERITSTALRNGMVNPSFVQAWLHTLKEPAKHIAGTTVRMAACDAVSEVVMMFLANYSTPPPPPDPPPPPPNVPTV